MNQRPVAGSEPLDLRCSTCGGPWEPCHPQFRETQEVIEGMKRDMPWVEKLLEAFREHAVRAGGTALELLDKENLWEIETTGEETIITLRVKRSS